MRDTKGLDNVITEVIVYNNPPALSCHEVRSMIADRYPDYVRELGSVEESHRFIGHALNRLTEKGLLIKGNKINGKRVYEYARYDRTPDRGKTPEERKVKVQDVMHVPFSPVEEDKTASNEVLLEVIRQLMDQNKSLLETIVSLTK